MAIYTVIKLKNLSPLHLGTGRENYDFSAAILQSDTLSASLAAMKAQNGERENLNEFLESFRISSAFPFYDDHFFLPKPIGKLNIEINGSSVSEFRKRLKKIQYIELNSWCSLMGGERLIASGLQVQSNFFLDEKSIVNFNKPSVNQVNQRVTISRDENSESTPFFFDWTYFDGRAGLYCLTDAEGILLDELVRLFKLLGETGIGTDKNIGGGKFEVETMTLDFSVPVEPNATILLSLYIPAPEEVESLQLSEARYELLLRGGYIAGSSEVLFRHFRKKSIYMFGPGSVFQVKTNLCGTVVDLAPDWNDSRMHPVWRSGRPFCLPIKL
jgi:CRISPR-associated protein Csm4